MQSAITSRGQTVIPAEVRRRFHPSPADRLEWIVDGEGIRVIPVRNDPIRAFRGSGRGGTVAALLDERGKDRARD